MARRLILGLSVAMVVISCAAAQDSPPSYQADPSVYKVIFEDQNFRVISATWRKGVSDKPHSHPLPFVTYALNDCTIRIHNPDGSTREVKNKAGAAAAGPVTSSHTAENAGDSDCQVIFVERK